MKTKFGYMPCLDCGQRVVVKVNENETLSYGCDECDGSAYCKKGEGRYAGWLKKIDRPAEIAARVAAAAPDPGPPAKKKGEPGFFDTMLKGAK